MKLRYLFKPPCRKCPYRLGLAHTIRNPCPACKRMGYAVYQMLKKECWTEMNAPISTLRKGGGYE